MSETVPNSTARRLFGFIMLVATAAALIALIEQFRHDYPPPRWTDAVFATVFALIGLNYLLFPERWQIGFSRWVPIALFFALSAANLYDALKG